MKMLLVVFGNSFVNGERNLIFILSQIKQPTSWQHVSRTKDISVILI